MYKAKPINNKLDLTSYAVDVFNQNIIYGYESLGEYVANHLYLKRIILDLSHWKTGVVDFLDTPYSLYSFIFSATFVAWAFSKQFPVFVFFSPINILI